MSKLSPEALEELRASDPAAFDDDVPADAPIPAKDEAADAARERDESGRFKTKAAEPAAAVDDPAKADKTDAAPDDARPDVKPDEAKVEGIPKPRFDEVIAERNREREGRLAAERRNAELEAAQAKASQRDYTGELDALEQQYDDGDIEFKAYQKARDELVAGQAQEAALAAHTERMQKQAEQDREAAWSAAQATFFTEHPTYAESKVRMGALKEVLAELAPQGFASFTDLLAQAHAQVEAELSPKGEPAAPVVSARAAQAAAAATAAANTPPSIMGGVGGRGTAAGVIDLKHMKQGNFSKLSKQEQEALLGEGAL